MTFLAPAMLWLLPLGLLPVVFHLFFRVRRQPRPFSSLLFFLAADPRLSARRRIREWLLLVLRCLLLLSLLLALARPVRRGRGSGGATLVAVIDNSASMQATGPAGESRLARAVAAAALLCEDEAVAFAGLGTTVADAPASMPAGVTADRGRLRAALGSIRPTHASGEPLRALQAAIGSVRGALRTFGEVHVFTDLQAIEWESSLGDLPLPPGIALQFHDVGNDDDLAGSVSLAALAPPPRPLLAGRPWKTRVQLRNEGDADAEVILNVQAGTSGGPHREAVTVPARGVRELSVALPAPAVGEQRVQAWLEGRSAGAAAVAWLAVPASEGADVILVGGSEAPPHGLLAAALAPGGEEALTGLRVGFVPPEALAGRLAEPSRPALVAVTAEQLAQDAVARPLHAYLMEGGHALVAPAADGTAAPPPLPAGCGMGWDNEFRDETGGDWKVLDADDALWDELRSADGTPLWREIRVFRAYPLRMDEAEALAGLDPGRALLARQGVGRGSVTVSGVAWDPRWSNLPHKASFVALAQGLALAGLGGFSGEQGIAGRRLSGGSDPATDAPRPPDAPIEVIAREGDQGRWQLAPSEARLPARAGLYQFTQGTVVRQIAVSGDPREAVARRVRGERVPALAAVPHQIIRARNATARRQEVQRLRRGRSLYTPLLLVAVAALLGELFVEGWRRNQAPKIRVRKTKKTAPSRQIPAPR